VRYSTFLMVTSLALAACSNGDDVSGVPMTAPSADQQIDRTVSLDITNGCTGEVIRFTGGINENFQTTFDAAGGFRLVVHINPQGLTGTGKDGTVYEAVGSYTERLLSAPGGTEVVTVTSVLNVVSKGAGPNFRLIEVHHVTVNPDGTVTAEIEQATTSC
jgi:hypothetical protein